MSNQFKKFFASNINAGKFTILKTTHPDIFAYAISYNRKTILVVGNYNFDIYARGDVKIPKYNSEIITLPIKITEGPLLGSNKMSVNLNPGEIQILIINDFEI